LDGFGWVWMGRVGFGLVGLCGLGGLGLVGIIWARWSGISWDGFGLG